MARPRRCRSLLVSMFALVPACYGGPAASDEASSGASTGSATGGAVGTDSGAGSSGGAGTATTGDSGAVSTEDSAGTGAATVTTGAATTGSTGALTTSGTDTGSSTTGGPGPADIPEIPQDGLPSSAHYQPIPLGTSAAKQGYWEYLPPGYGGGAAYPLLVFLHGIGENGDGNGDLAKVNATGLPQLIQQDLWPTDRPFVVVAPQHPGDGCPGPAEVHDFIAYAASAYDINPGRVYLTGLSCGAIGAWGYLGQYLDEQIVAMVPIAGDGKGAFNQAQCMLGKVPLWAFHGDADPTVDVSGTIEPITNLQLCDPKPEAEMVIYPGVGHNSWQMTYDLSAGHDIYAWLLAHYRE